MVRMTKDDNRELVETLLTENDKLKPKSKLWQNLLQSSPRPSNGICSGPKLSSVTLGHHRLAEVSCWNIPPILSLGPRTAHGTPAVPVLDTLSRSSSRSPHQLRIG